MQAGNADQATELAFMLMSTVKDFPDESFERKSVCALAITKYAHHFVSIDQFCLLIILFRAPSYVT